MIPQTPQHQLYEKFENFHPVGLRPLFDSNQNPVPLYAVTNEADSHYTQATLPNLKLFGNTLLTLSGVCALEQFAAGTFTYLLHIDPNIEQKRLWKIFIEAIYSAHNSQEAIDSILERSKAEFSSTDAFSALSKYFTKPNHALCSEERFEKLHSAIEQGRIFSLALNLHEEASLAQFCKICQENSFTIALFYASNLLGSKWLGRKIFQVIKTICSINHPKAMWVIYAAVINCRCTKNIAQRTSYIKIDTPCPNPKRSCLMQIRHNVWAIRFLYDYFLRLYDSSIINHAPIKKTDQKSAKGVISTLPGDLNPLIFKLLEIFERASIQQNTPVILTELSTHFPAICEQYFSTQAPPPPILEYIVTILLEDIKKQLLDRAPSDELADFRVLPL